MTKHTGLTYQKPELGRPHISNEGLPQIIWEVGTFRVWLHILGGSFSRVVLEVQDKTFYISTLRECSQFFIDIEHPVNVLSAADQFGWEGDEPPSSKIRKELQVALALWGAAKEETLLLPLHYGAGKDVALALSFPGNAAYHRMGYSTGFMLDNTPPQGLSVVPGEHPSVAFREVCVRARLNWISVLNVDRMPKVEGSPYAPGSAAEVTMREDSCYIVAYGSNYDYTTFYVRQGSPILLFLLYLCEGFKDYANKRRDIDDQNTELIKHALSVVEEDIVKRTGAEYFKDRKCAKSWLV